MVIPFVRIPKKVSGGSELVVVNRRDFEMFRKWQEETRDAVVKIRRGKEEYHKGKTITADSSRAFR